MIAKCGADCDKCPLAEELDCPGCGAEDGVECDICSCCKSKNLPHCGKCGSFPCDMLRDAAFDEKTGDDGERLIHLKHLNEEEWLPLRRKFTCVLAGVSAGFAAGAIVGGISGAFGVWLFAGVVIGGGAGLIASYAAEGKKRL